MTDKQIEAVAAANELIGLCNQIRTLNSAIVSLTTRASARAFQTTWNAQPTFSWNADGTPGTPDVANVGKPIVGLNITASDLGTLLDIAQKYQDCGNNVAVAQSARINTLNSKLN
jgi:hypothetical protein